MANETHTDSSAAQKFTSSSGEVSPSDDFISIREIIQMVLQKWKAIAAFVSLATLTAGIFFIVSPKEFEAEGYLQVIPPMTQDGRVDKELFETMIVSYLQRASSAFILTKLSNSLNKEGLQIALSELEKKITIKRPPKTDLIRVTATATSADQALMLADRWIREYLESVKKNNAPRALSRVRLQLKDAQSDLMEKEAATERLRAQASQTTPLVTLSRAVDDRQLWSDLAQKAVPDSERLKKLSEIHIKGQEQSEDFINFKKALFVSEQALAAASAKRDLFLEVERLLEALIIPTESDHSMRNVESGDKTSPSEAERYLKVLLKSTEVVQFGEPGLITASRGIIKKTSLVFLTSLVLACFCAYIHAWWTASGPGKSQE